MKKSIIGLKELRENTDAFITQVAKGNSFIVVRKSKPVFRITAPDDTDELWESVIDFTKIQKGGVTIEALLARL